MRQGAAGDRRCRHPERRRAVAYVLTPEVNRAAVEGPSSTFLRVGDAQGVLSEQGQSAAVRLTATRQPAFLKHTLSRSPQSNARAKWGLRLRLGKPLRLKVTTRLASAQDDRAFRQVPRLPTRKAIGKPVARTTCCPGAQRAQEAKLVLPDRIRHRVKTLASCGLRPPGQQVVRATRLLRNLVPKLHLGTRLLEPTPLAIPARAMELRRQGRSQMEFGNEEENTKFIRSLDDERFSP